MLNGDLRKPRFTHVEQGCCPGGPVEIKQKFSAALLQGVGITMYGSGTPAASRWGSLALTNAEFVLAEMAHGGFRRLYSLAFPKKDLAEASELEKELLVRPQEASQTVSEFKGIRPMPPTPSASGVCMGAGCKAAGCKAAGLQAAGLRAAGVNAARLGLQL